MPNTLGYHYVKSAYGLWLPGDDRGSWSESWDAQLGFIEPHALHEGDPIRHRMAQERMTHPPVRFTNEMITAITNAIADCVNKSNGGLTIAAFTIEPTHMHALIPYSARDIDKTTKWLADQTTKAVHQHTPHDGQVWCKGNWCSYVFDEVYWQKIKTYIQNHNKRRNLPANPYPFISL